MLAQIKTRSPYGPSEPRGSVEILQFLVTHQSVSRAHGTMFDERTGASSSSVVAVCCVIENVKYLAEAGEVVVVPATQLFMPISGSEEEV